MATRPIEDLADALAVALGAGFDTPPTAGANVFFGPVRPQGDGVPHKALFTGPGVASSPDKAFRGSGVRNAAVQVRSRGNVGDFDGAWTLAENIRDAVNDMVTIPGSLLQEYMSVEAVDSEPLSLGQDDQEHWEMAVNVEMKYTIG